MTSVTTLTQALDVAHDKACLRWLYLGFPLRGIRHKPKRRRDIETGIVAETEGNAAQRADP